MRDDNDNNYISTKRWMLLMLVPSIPIIGWILVLVLAFTGDNQTRKNYFRAILCWIALVLVLAVLVIFLSGAYGDFPALQKLIHSWKHAA